VAGEWRAAPGGRPVHFLAESHSGQVTVEKRSSTVSPRPDQIARTRDVAHLGDALPAGLVLGRVVDPEHDAPGGGLVRDGDAWTLEEVVDPFDVGLVTVETARDVAPGGRRVVGMLARTVRARSRLRVDRGTSDGVAPGDWVVQDGVLVGLVTVAGRGSSELRTRLPDMQLLVVDDGQVVPCHSDAGRWPEDWTPQTGMVVATGHPGEGGLLLGTVGVVDPDGFELVRAPVDVNRPVSLLEP
jgi:hypothetical protein